MAATGGESVDMNIKEGLVPQFTAISLTHVQYQKGDVLGYLLAWMSLMPFCILVGFVTLIVFRRDLHTVSYFLGLLLNEVFNWILKHTIRERRPPREFEVLFTEYGMPSSHSQFMFFLFSYMVLFLFIRIYHNYNWVDDIWKYFIGAGTFVCAVLVSYSRVYLGYHTFHQVAWGFVVGTVLGCVWFAVVHIVLTPFYPYIASSPLGELIMVRDSTLIPHVLWFEYTSSRSEARSRQRKVTSRKSQ